MQRKIVNTKKVWSGVYIQSRQKKLHSIPILLNMKKSVSQNNNSKKSSVLYSIPCVKSCAHSFCRIKLFNNKLNNTTFAILCLSVISLVSLMGGDKCSAATSASLSLSNPNMTSTAITPGSTATVSTNVTVSVDNADSYSLSLKVDSTTLQNGSTTIVPGNPNDDTKTNVWGYKWDKDTNTSTYKSPSTTGTNLTVPALTNGAANFEGTLTFAAKFASDASTGSYKNTGSILLTATPNSVTLSSLENMQDMTPEICVASTLEETKQLKDTRDNKFYWVAKLKDGRCWMTQNLDYGNSTQFDDSARATITAASNGGFKGFGPTSYYNPGIKTFEDDRLINGATSDEHSLVGDYYAYTAALPDYSMSTPSSGVAAQGICPNQWHIPTGNTNGELATLFNEVSITDATKAPYYLTYTGAIVSGALGNTWSDENGEAPSLQLNSSATYWSSSNYSTGDSKLPYYVYALTLASNSIKASDSVSWYKTGSVRCIANN